MNIRASRWARLQAAVLDWIYCWWPLILAVTLSVALDGFAHSPAVERDVEPWLVAVGLFGVAIMVIRNLWLLARSGQTWGKQRLNLLVVMEDGRRAPSNTLYWRAFAPYVLMVIPIINMVTYFDCWFILGSASRCLHDYLAGTIVIEADSYEEPGDEGTGLSRSYDDIGFTRVR